MLLQSHIVTVLFYNTALRPLQPTTLASSTAIATESLTKKEPIRVPTTTAPTQQSTTNTHVTTEQQSTTSTHVTTEQQSTKGTHVTTAQQSATDTQVTTHVSHQTTATLLHRRRTAVGSVVPFGSENKGDDGYFDVQNFVRPHYPFPS